MAWTRRQFLYRTTILGTAVMSGTTVGCSSRVGGEPRPDPDVLTPPEPAEETSSAEPVQSVRVGLLNYPSTEDSGGDVRGPGADVARAVLEQLDVTEIEFVLHQEPQTLMLRLQAGDIDLAGGLDIRTDLCTNLTFSVPDFVSGTALIVPAGNPKGLKTYADVKAKGAKIAVMTNLPEQADTKAAGIPAGQLVPLPDPLQMMDAVEQGRADCAAFDDIGSRSLVKSRPGGKLAVSKPFTPPNRLPLVGAFAFAKDNTDLLESFNNRLTDLHESGDWMAIVAPYGFTEDNLPPPDLTTEKACAG
jgi:polar amino acid transport system substrate-binding protein